MVPAVGSLLALLLFAALCMKAVTPSDNSTREKVVTMTIKSRLILRAFLGEHRFCINPPWGLSGLVGRFSGGFFASSAGYTLTRDAPQSILVQEETRRGGEPNKQILL